MTKHVPIFAKAKTAAALLEMSTAEFLRRVRDGALPPATKFERWDIEHLQKSMRGEAIDTMDGVEW